MHSVYARVQNVFGYFTTVASFVALAIALTSLLSTPTPQLSETSLVLKNVQVVKGRPHYYSQKKEEYAHIKFDLDVDLSSLFTWNTKQVFLYVTATYPSKSPSTIPPSTAVIWDAILPHPLAPEHHNYYIPPSTASKSKSKKSSKQTKEQNSKHPGILRLAGQRPKYQITDPSGKLASRTNATLELHYNIQPWVGALTWSSPTPRVTDGLPSSKRSPSKGIFNFLNLWRYLPGEVGRSASFNMPALKEKQEAAKAAGSEGLGTAKGAERNRGSPA